MIIWLNLI